MTSVSKSLALFACLAAPMLSLAQQAEMPDPASFKIGDTWEWLQVDNRTKQQEAKQTRSVLEVAGVLQFSNGITSSPLSMALVDGTNKPSSKPWRVWPLQVGKKWSVNADWIRPDGVTGNTKQDAEVAAYEEVVVPAGKFMAFRIEHRGWYQNSQGYRGKQNDSYWYAPDAQADVKHVRDDGYNLYTRELVSYKRGAP
jgi:hypothetical protein